MKEEGEEEAVGPEKGKWEAFSLRPSFPLSFPPLPLSTIVGRTLRKKVWQ